VGKRLKSFSRDTTGAALVEFAIIVPVLVVLAFGIVDYSMLINNTTALIASTRSGTEIVRSNPTITTSQMTALFPSGATIQPLTTSCTCVTSGTYSGSCPPAPDTAPCAGQINPNTGLADSRVLEYITVTASESYRPWMSWASFMFPPSVSSSAVARIQ
jgi:Flp pilus assembly protein TadG